jgi:hypothetical protein
MIPAVQQHMESFDELTRQRFIVLYQLVLQSTDCEVEERLWAKIPSIYCGKNFVRLIPFKDHINIEAIAVAAHKDELQGYRMTPKGMLQIDHQQDIPTKLLKGIFKETLETN